MPYVYLINQHGRPLMPCLPAKARHLLNDGKAKVKKREPFTLQLLHGSTGYAQPVVLTVNAGSQVIGLSATTETRELYKADVQVRNFPKPHRNRRYRRPRTKTQIGRLAPEAEYLVQQYIVAINRVFKILPISQVIVNSEELSSEVLEAIRGRIAIPKYDAPERDKGENDCETETDFV